MTCEVLPSPLLLCGHGLFFYAFLSFVFKDILIVTGDFFLRLIFHLHRPGANSSKRKNIYLLK